MPSGMPFALQSVMASSMCLMQASTEALSFGSYETNCSRAKKPPPPSVEPQPIIASPPHCTRSPLFWSLSKPSMAVFTYPFTKSGVPACIQLPM